MRVGHQFETNLLCGRQTFEALVFSVFCTGPVIAQDAGIPFADAGALTRQAAEARPVLDDRDQDDGAAISLPSLYQEILDGGGPVPGDPTLYLRAWEFRGNTIFDTAALREALSSITGRYLTFSQLYSATSVVEAYYAASGYFVQVTLPPQEVVNGVVLIDIVEAEYAGVEFEGDLPTRVRPDFVRRVFDAHVAKGEPLKLNEFDLPSLLVNDLPGIAVTGAFAPGRNPGETILLIHAIDAPFVFGQALLDNSGARATGSARALGQFALNSPLGYGDLLRADITGSEGSKNFSGSYAFPLGVSGAKLTVNGSMLNYDVTTQELRELYLSGESSTLGLAYSVPLRRSRDLNVFLNLAYSSSSLENNLRGDVVSDYRVRSTSIGMSGNWRDQFGAGAFTSFGVSFATGSANGTGPEGEFDAAFSVVRFNAERQQFLSDKTALFLGVSGQDGPQGLDSSEEFSLGGPNAVRAYPVGEAGGPSGAVLNLEIRHQIHPNWSLAGFYDHGMVSGRDEPNEPDSYNIKGVGVALGWVGPNGWGADLTWAHRIGSNPNSIVDANSGAIGHDQDGSLNENRFWLSVRKMF